MAGKKKSVKKAASKKKVAGSRSSVPRSRSQSKPKKKAAAAAPKLKKKAAAAAPKPVSAKAVSAKALSTFAPLEDRIVVSVKGPSETTTGGIIIPGTVASRPSRGTVLAKGRGKRNKKGQLRPLDVEVGDEVLFTEYVGTKLTLEGNEVLILREEEILGLVEK